MPQEGRIALPHLGYRIAASPPTSERPVYPTTSLFPPKKDPYKRNIHSPQASRASQASPSPLSHLAPPPRITQDSKNPKNNPQEHPPASEYPTATPPPPRHPTHKQASPKLKSQSPSSDGVRCGIESNLPRTLSILRSRPGKE